MSSRILILYGTSYGQTAKIARYVADTITSRGDFARVVDADHVPTDLALSEFDGAIIGASVIRSRHQGCVRRFVTENLDALNAMPSAFFSVSASAASHNRKGKIDALRCMDDFLHLTGWWPSHTESVAGALTFTKYNSFLRWVLKQISKRNGGPTDTSRDHELTDWAQVERFVETFMNDLPHDDYALPSAVSSAVHS